MDSVTAQMNIIINHYRDLLLRLLVVPQVPFDKNLHGTLPHKGGVYRVFESGADWKNSVYVGKSGDLQNRLYNDLLMGNLSSHPLKKKLIKTGRFADAVAVKQYLRDKCVAQFLLIAADNERTLFEHFAIAVLRPDFND